MKLQRAAIIEPAAELSAEQLRTMTVPQMIEYFKPYTKPNVEEVKWYTYEDLIAMRDVAFIEESEMAETLYEEPKTPIESERVNTDQIMRMSGNTPTINIRGLHE